MGVHHLSHPRQDDAGSGHKCLGSLPHSRVWARYLGGHGLYSADEHPGGVPYPSSTLTRLKMGRVAYEQVKEMLARLHPENLAAYYDVKDPVCDIIMGAAERWASETS